MSLMRRTRAGDIRRFVFSTIPPGKSFTGRNVVERVEMSKLGDLFLVLGVLLFCAGTLLGIPHGLAKRRGDTKRTELWRIAHLSTCLGGASLIAMDLALERLFPTLFVYTMVPLSFSAYCFFLACSLSGVLNKSWDDERNQAGVVLVYRLQIVASALALLAVAAAVVSVFRTALF